MEREVPVGDGSIRLMTGDITKVETDAIVNAANESLLGGGGVDGAIHRAGGPTILEESRKLGGCRTGDAKPTTAGNLPARYVVHAVGPIWGGGQRGEPDLLRSAYRRSLEVARDLECERITFPAISAGAYGYPLPDAARIGVETTMLWLAESDPPRRITFVLFSDATYRAFSAALDEALRQAQP